jgi:hypothetical protein
METPSPQVAISLRNLFKPHNSADLTPYIKLTGLTRLDGYTLTQDDLIIWGQSNWTEQNLQVIDLVAALKAALGFFDEVKDGVRYRTAPYVSLDPEGDWKHDPSELQLGCIFSSKQKVRTGGIPSKSNIAKVLLDADYEMKKVSLGEAQLLISSPFDSYVDAAIRAWRSSGGRGDARATRYWFEPGEFLYGFGSNSGYLKRARIVLKDEDETGGSASIASGKVNQLSRAFSCAWTERMDDIIRSDEIWRKLYNVYRLIAVTRAMAERIPQLGRFFDLSTWRGPIIDEQYIPDHFRSLYRSARLENRREVRTYAVCGGVSMRFARSLAESTVQLSPSEAAFMAQAEHNIIKSKPEEQAIAWRVSAG